MTVSTVSSRPRILQIEKESGLVVGGKEGTSVDAIKRRAETDYSMGVTATVFR